MFLTTVQALCFGLITGVFTYSFLLSREERESNIKFSDFEQAMPQEPASEEQWQSSPPGDEAASEVTPKVYPSAQVAFPEAQPAPAAAAEAPVAATAVQTIKYKRSLSRCWKCNDEMYLYTWNGHRPWQVTPPPEPVPDAVQLRLSNALNIKYWANTCLKCGSAQPDDLIFGNPSALAWEDF
jgi:hypothetical protein